MSESVVLPALGESVTEGTVTRWLKQVGDRVEVDEPLLEVSTDKVDTEIPSPIAGVIEQILVGEDETVEVGTPLVTIGSGAEAPAEAPAPEAAAPVAEEPAPAAEEPVAEAPAPEPAPVVEAPAPVSSFAPPEPLLPPVAPPPVGEPAIPAPNFDAPVEVPAAAFPPPAEEPAAEYVPPAPQWDAPAPTTLPVSEFPPPTSAPVTDVPAPAAYSTPEPTEAALAAPPVSGYVTPIVRKLASEAGVDLSTVTGSGIGGRIRKEDVLAAAAPGAPAAESVKAAPAALPTDSPLRGTTAAMSRLRKVVSERAVISLQSTAQLTTVVEADVTALAAYRSSVKGPFEQATGAKLNFLPFFVLAAAEALRQFPIVNATVDPEQNIVYPDHENISIAVDTERGLLTPVVRNASELTLAEIATEIADLAARTRDNKLKPDELSGGTFTVTNTGSRGALFDTPLVFLPQSAILGTGIVSKKPGVVTVDGEDRIEIRSTVYLALSYDHRIIDGADAARFLGAVKSRLEAADFGAALGI